MLFDRPIISFLGLICLSKLGFPAVDFEIHFVVLHQDAFASEQLCLKISSALWRQGNLTRGADDPVPGQIVFSAAGTEQPGDQSAAIGVACQAANLGIAGNLSRGDGADEFQDQFSALLHQYSKRERISASLMVRMTCCPSSMMELKSSRLPCWSFMIFSSTVPRVMRRKTFTLFTCPIR